MALRTAVFDIVVHQHDTQRDHDETDDDQEDRPRRKFPAAVAAEVDLAAFENRGRSRNARDHARAVIAFAKSGKHIVELDAFAECVGKDAFEAAARDETDFPQILHEQDAQTVVAFGAAHAPTAEQVDGERKRIAAGDVVDGNDGDLSKAPLAQGSANGIDARHGAGRQDAVRIGDITPPVHLLDIGNLLRAISPRKGG